LAFTTTSGAGGTSLIGTSGVDTVSLNAGSVSAPLYIGAQADNDIVNFITNAVSTARVELGKGNDISTIGVNAGTTTLSGNDGDDTININGSITSSTINGNAGADTLTMADGVTITTAKVYGGQGNDTITLGTAAGAGITFAGGAINGNIGDDTINVSLAGNMSSSGSSAATVFGGAGSDFITEASAAARNSILSGDDGADAISGNTGNDTMYGGEGADRLAYLAADADGVADTLVGGNGVDTFGMNAAGNSGAMVNSAASNGASIVAGASYLFGSASNAGTAVAGTANSVDVITDFTAGAGGDRIDLLSGGAFTNAGIGAAIGANNTLYAISGSWTASTGTFVVGASNTSGADTLIIAANATGFVGANQAYVLTNVNASQVVAANLV